MPQNPVVSLYFDKIGGTTTLGLAYQRVASGQVFEADNLKVGNSITVVQDILVFIHFLARIHNL